MILRIGALAFVILAFHAAPARAAEKRTETSAPIKIAVFEFESEDYSAAAGIAARSPTEAAQLSRVTAEVREMLVKSGRYRLIDVAAAHAKAVDDHTLRDCGGCDAAIARTLGAEQSFVGVVTRISRTEYTVENQIRDTRTGKIVFRTRTDLRMGADYSWNRGAAWLIKNRLLPQMAGRNPI